MSSAPVNAPMDSEVGGGGGGAFASSSVTVTPGTRYTIFVGAGGTGPTGAGSGGGSGQNSTFATTTVVAAGGTGGSGGAGSPGGGAGGTVAASTGSVRFAGGAGGNGANSGDVGGGGGGAAGPHGAGANGANGSGGVGGNGGSGDNGSGGSGGPGVNGTYSDLSNGSDDDLGGGGGGGGDNTTQGGFGGSPGGGGGGGEANAPTGFGGGVNGQCTVTYDAPATELATSTLVSKADGTSGGYKLYIDTAGNICFAIDDDGTWGPEDTACTSGTNYYDGDWHHIVAEKDGTTGITLYVDNMKAAAASDTSLTATGDLSNAADLTFGNDSEGSYAYFGGRLDEVRVYDKLLAVDERKRLGAIGSTMVVNSSQAGKVTGGLAAHYSLDGGTVGTGYALQNVATTTNTLEKFFMTAAPNVLTTADQTITGAAVTNGFSITAKAGDLNGDGYDDIAASAWTYNSNQGRVYVFYGNAEGDFPASAANADVIITGEGTGDVLGNPGLLIADVNADGIEDLILGGYGYNTAQGRMYIYYGGSLTTGDAAAVADVIYTGQSTLDRFGWALTAGDFNDDGDVDIAASAFGYNNNDLTGRVYIFHGPAFATAGAGTADVIITGESTNTDFGNSVLTGDWDNDGKDDIAVGAGGYNSEQGRAYIFYDTNITTETAAGADVTLTGETSTTGDFGNAIYNGDVNDDGTDDLIVSAWKYNSNQGRSYVFYGGSMVSENASGADVTLTGDGTGGYFGRPALVFDFDQDGNNDILFGSEGHNSNQGRGYIFNSSVLTGSVGTSSAEVLLTGEATGNFYSLMLNLDGDFNGDGVGDLLIGSDGTSSDRGRMYLYYSDIQGVAYATGTKLTRGRMGQAVEFDGVNDEASIGTSTESLRSVSFWMKADDTTSRGVLDLNGAARVELNASSQVTATSWTSPTYYVDGVQGARTVTGDWHHVVITTATGISATNTALGLANGSHFDGRLDEVRLYNYELSQDEVNRLSAQGGTMVVNAPQKSKQTNSLIGYWTFDGPDVRPQAKTPYVKNVIRDHGFATTSLESSTSSQSYTEGSSGSKFGASVAFGDYNNDGDIDMAVGAEQDGGFDGRGYIFYGDGTGVFPTTSASRDVRINGETTSFLGTDVATGDFNDDGTDDLVVSAYGYSGNTGRVYIFYGGALGATLTAGSSEDVTITGETSSDFGNDLIVGDFNNDTIDDLAIAARVYGTDQGRVYIFYGGSLGASLTAGVDEDVLITGESANTRFGWAISAGDYDGDADDDLVVGAYQYDSNRGRTYVFENDGSYPSGAGSADVIITGAASSGFGRGVTVADFNDDGTADVAVGAYLYNSNEGRGYIFYGGSIAASSSALMNADVVITGQSSSALGVEMSHGDFNADQVADLAMGANTYNSIGRAYLIYGGSIPSSITMGSDEDVYIDGEIVNDYFGSDLAANDVNGDGYDDLIAGYADYNGGRGRVYVYHTAVPNAGTSTSVSPAKGRIGQGISFNGSTDSVRVGDMSAEGDIKSISFWMKADDITSRRVIGINGTGYIQVNGSSQITANGWSSPTYFVDGVSGAQTITGDWHHIVITNNTSISPTNVEFGKSSTQYFDGILDEIRFYDYELSQDDVTRLYLQGS